MDEPKRKIKIADGLHRNSQGVVDGKIYPKGDVVYSKNKTDRNGAGEHRAFSEKGKMIIANRADSRKKTNLPYYTKKNKSYKKFSAQEFYTKKEAKELGFKAWRLRLAKRWERPVPSEPVSMSNHDRHTLREAQRRLGKLDMNEVKS